MQMTRVYAFIYLYAMQKELLVLDRMEVEQSGWAFITCKLRAKC